MNVRFEEIATGGDGTAEAFLATAPREARQLGDIAVIVDTTMLPEPLRYLGAVIAGAVKREYYGSGSTSIQRSFTAALRAANDALATEAQNGSAQWVGALHAIVVASDHDSLLIAQTGGCAAYLGRHGRVQEIPLETGEGTRPFGSYSSGKLQSGDALLFGSRNALAEQPVDPDLVTQPERLFKALQRSGVSALALSANPDLSPAYATASTAEHLRDALALGGSLLMQLIRAIRKQLVPAAMRGVAFVQAKIAERTQRRRTTAPEETPVMLYTENADTTEETKEAEKVSETEDVPQTTEPETATFNDAIPMTTETAQPTVTPVRRGAPVTNLLQKLQAVPRKRLVPGGAIALMLIAAAILLPQMAQRDAKLAAAITAEALEAAETALEKGETELILGNEAEAIAAFSEGLAALGDLPEGDHLRRELLKQRNALAGIREAQVRDALSFSGFPVELAASRLAVIQQEQIGTSIALAGQRHPAVWMNDAIEPTDGTFAVLPHAFRSGVADVVSVPAVAAFIAATPDGLVAFDTASRAVIATALAPEGVAYDFIAADADTIFALDAAGQDIYRVTLTRTEKDEEEPATATLSTALWMSNADTRLTDTRDLVVSGGEALALVTDTGFLGLLRGRRAILYTIEGFNWAGAATAFVGFGADQLLVLDTANGRVLRTAANGDIVEQYEVPQARAGTALGADAGGFALILTDTGVTEVTLPPSEPSEE
jgi:hypothetical protein